MKVLSPERLPTLGGLLCFGKEPQKFKRYARITAIRHKGVEIGEEFLDRRDLGGTVEHQVRSARAFIREHLRSPDRVLADVPPSASIEGLFEAVDEAIVNAVAHRDYLLASQTRLFVFDDRVEVLSPGRLLNTITIETLRLGCHLVRNPVIFSHLAGLRLAADTGLGVPNMIRLVRQLNLPDPEFSLMGHEFRVTFRLQSKSDE